MAAAKIKDEGKLGLREDSNELGGSLLGMAMQCAVAALTSCADLSTQLPCTDIQARRGEYMMVCPSISALLAALCCTVLHCPHRVLMCLAVLQSTTMAATLRVLQQGVQ